MTRCSVCNKNTFEYKCKCDDVLVFCAKHRYAEEHNCIYNFKEEQRKKIENENPKIEIDKVSSI